MATWVTHLRIAENLLKKYDLDEKAFVVGNIAPDSGVPNEDWSEFDPPKEITHWIENINGIATIKSKDFFQKYINKKDIKKDRERYSFLLGYYFHLLIDMEWDKKYREMRKFNSDIDKQLLEDPKFIWEIKKDWYGLDFIYLKENKSSIFYTIFKKINKVEDYLNYFPRGAFERQVKYITSFYLENIEKENENREFIYLSKSEMDDFVNNTTDKIDELIREEIA